MRDPVPSGAAQLAFQVVAKGHLQRCGERYPDLHSLGLVDDDVIEMGCTG
jgi:hypothetical protein